MIKTKSKEIMKVVAVSVLSIGIMSAAIIGINSQAFAGATNGGESMPFIVAQAAIAPTATLNAQEISEDFQEPTLTIIELQENNPSSNALSTENAAMLGAIYIWDMFGECIDGMYVDMQYNVWPSHTRTYWSGIVSESEEASKNNQFLFSFLIDSATGERIDIQNISSTVRSDAVQAALYEQHTRTNFGANVDGTGNTIFDEILNLRISRQMPEQLDEQSQVAKELAQRHFINTEVVSAEFVSFGVYGLDLDESGNLVIAYRLLTFDVTDSSGRVATVAFNETTGNLFSISTVQNDVIPGFGYGGQ